MLSLHHDNKTVRSTPTGHLPQSSGTQELQWFSKQWLTYSKDLNPLVNLSLLLSVFCIEFPQRILMKRAQGHTNSMWTKDQRHLDSPLFFIKEKRASSRSMCFWWWDQDWEHLLEEFYKCRWTLQARGLSWTPQRVLSPGALLRASRCHGLHRFWVSTKQTTGNVFLACPLLPRLSSHLVLYIQASKPTGNITILGKKTKPPTVFTSNMSKCQENGQDEADLIQRGLWPGGNTLLGISLEHQPPAFLLRNCS